MKKIASLLLSLLISTSIFSQTEKTIVVPVEQSNSVEMPITIEEVTTQIVDAIAEGATNITIEFAGGATFFANSTMNLTAAVGLKQLTLTSDSDTPATLSLKVVTVGVPLDQLLFKNVNLMASSSSTTLLGLTPTAFPASIQILNCMIGGYNKGILGGTFSSSPSIDMTIDNCELGVGGNPTVMTGLVINGGESCKSVSFTNSTFINMKSVFENKNWTPNANSTLNVSNCTFYNNATNQVAGAFLRLSKNPIEGTTIEKNIIASAIDNAANYCYSSGGYNGLDFSTSFATSNITASKLNSIQFFTGSAATLFVDPDNKDFSFNSEVSGDILQAGDPTRNRKPTPSSIQSVENNVMFRILNDRIEVEGDDVCIRLYTINGQLIMQSNQNQISTAGLTKGIYLVKISSDGQSISDKLSIGAIQR